MSRPEQTKQRAPTFLGAPELTTSDNSKLFHFFKRNFGADDLDGRLSPGNTWTIRSLTCGDLTLGYSSAQAPIRVSGGPLPRLVFSFNASGQTGYGVGGHCFSPPAGMGWLLTTPAEPGHMRYVRAPGEGQSLAEGNFISLEASSLLAVAKAINGPMARHLLHERLVRPLSFIPFAASAGSPYARSLIDSLKLVNGLMRERKPLPAALCLDDLIQRQLVLMLCPELAHAEFPGQSQGVERRFEQLLEWLRAHRHEAISLSTMEKQTGYTRRSLQKQFQKRFDCGPMQWLRRSRLELAYEQLHEPQPGDNVSAIARRCGYLNLASFSRDFIAAYGRRPSELLRAHLQEQ